MITISTVPTTVSLPKAETSVEVDVAAWPEHTLSHIFAYGLRQILNDAMAAAKTPGEAKGLADKRLANLIAGTLRAAPVREGDPIRKRALELALAAVKANATYIAWLGKSGLKPADKAAVAKAKSLAEAAIAKPDNRFTAQAQIDVASAKSLSIEELDIEV